MVALSFCSSACTVSIHQVESPQSRAEPNTPATRKEKRDQRRAVLDRTHPELSVRWQCALLSLARSGVYRPVAATDETDLALMRRIHQLFQAHPFLGSHRMARMLSREGERVNRKRVRRLMRL